jgi:hypothetical protein
MSHSVTTKILPPVVARKTDSYLSAMMAYEIGGTMCVLQGQLAQVSNGTDIPSNYFGSSLFQYPRSRIITLPEEKPLRQYGPVEMSSPVMFISLEDLDFGSASKPQSSHDWRVTIHSSVDSDGLINVKMGEFYLFPDTPSSIGTVNISKRIIMLPKVADQGGVEWSEYPMTRNTRPLLISQKILSHQQTSSSTPLSPGSEKFYFMYMKVPTKNRPPAYFDYDIETTNPLVSTSLRFGSINEGCFSQVRLLDEDIVADKVPELDPGQYVCNSKYSFLPSSLGQEILEITKAERGELPGRTEFPKFLDLAMILDPPTYYFSPLRMTERLIFPSTIVENDKIDDIEFKIKRSFKTEGNYHAGIEILDAEGTRILIQSSDGRFETGLKYLNVSPGIFYWSPDGTIFRRLTEERSNFNFIFKNEDGANSSDELSIVYKPSNSAYIEINKNPEVNIRIFLFDGTQMNQ